MISIDPIAIIVLSKELGCKSSLSAVGKGESLLNDGTALVISRILIKLMKGNTTDGVDNYIWSVVNKSYHKHVWCPFRIPYHQKQNLHFLNFCWTEKLLKTKSKAKISFHTGNIRHFSEKKGNKKNLNDVRKLEILNTIASEQKKAVNKKSETESHDINSTYAYVLVPYLTLSTAVLCLWLWSWSSVPYR